MWLLTVGATVDFSLPPGSGDPSVSVEEALLEALDFALIIEGEVRDGK